MPTYVDPDTGAPLGAPQRVASPFFTPPSPVYVDPTTGLPEVSPPAAANGPTVEKAAALAKPVTPTPYEQEMQQGGPLLSALKTGTGGKVVENVSRFGKTFAGDMAAFPLGMAEMMITPPHKLAQDVANTSMIELAKGNKVGAAAAVADLVSPIPLAPAITSAQAGQTPETLAHILSGLSMLGLGTAGFKGLGQVAEARRPAPPARPPAVQPPDPGLGPEFTPVGSEPPVTRPSQPDYNAKAFNRVAEKQGMGLERPQDAPGGAIAQGGSPTPGKTYVDPATGAPAGPVAPPRPGVLADQRGDVSPDLQPGPVWFSRLEKAMDTLPESKKGYHPDKLRSIARASTSADEIKWTGFDTFLAERKGKPISKAEVKAFLAENQLTLEEKLLTDPADLPDPVRDDSATGWEMIEGDTPGQTKYHPSSGHSESLSLPGGRNYRELLLKLPPEQWDSGDPSSMARAKSQPPYQSHHWPGEENVLAHIRFNDRTAPDGIKTLHIEEIQSDWHQAGREKGYKTGEGPHPQRNFRDWMAEHHPEATADQVYQRFSNMDDPLRQAWWTEHQRAYEHNVAEARGVPDAPFKGTKWQEVAFKRMLRYAAEKGYGRVTWTTGQQQTARYNAALGEALGAGHLDWSFDSALHPDGTTNIELLNPKSGELIWMGPPADLPGVVGKDFADRIVADFGKEEFQGPDGLHMGRTAIPPGTAAGSPGMVQQYDTNLPGFLSKYLKGWGGKVAQSEIPVGKAEPRMPHSVGTDVWRVFTEQGDDAAYAFLRQRGIGERVASQLVVDMQSAIDTRKLAARNEKVWSVDITPEMKGAVLREGQALGFAKVAPLLSAAGGTLGAAYGAATGDDTESRIRRGIGLGVLGAAAPILLSPRGQTRKPITDSLPSEVKSRLVQQGTLPNAQTALRKAWEVVRHDLVGDLFNAEHTLTRHGFGQVADAINQYKTKRMDVLANTLGDLKKVVEPLTDPSDYRDFWALVRLRRDLNSPPETPLEGGLNPDTARASLLILEDRLAQEAPQVLDAAQRHRDLMRSIGEELVASGDMNPTTLKVNDEYFPEYVLAHLTHPDTRLAQRWPLKYGTRGFLKRREGGERETLRDYSKAVLKYTAQVREGQLKDSLVDSLSKPKEEGGLGLDLVSSGEVTFGEQGQLIFKEGFDPKDWKVFTYKQGAPAHVLPKIVVDRLLHYTETPSPITALLNRATGVWKGVVLRAVWGAYNAGNFLGDSKRLWDFDPSWNPLKVITSEAQAAQAIYDVMRDADPTTLSPGRAQRLDLAKKGKEVGLGTGAATAEGGSNLKFDPQLRRLVRSDSPNPIRQVGAKLGDIVVGLGHAQDVVREYLENVPRTAKFMLEVERGNSPEVAGKVTRKVMIDYADLTPFEEKWLRGFLLPFYTFYKKNFASYAPGLAEGPLTGGKREGAALAGNAIAKTTALALGVTAWNTLVTREAENSLSEHEKNQFHINIPYGEGKVVSIGIPGPANFAAKTVGLGGATRRMIDLIRGKSDLGDEVAASTQQIRESALGLITPFVAEPYAQLQGEDLRTGRNITNPLASAGENLGSRVKHLGETFAPTSQMFRASKETGGDFVETAGEATRRYLTGNFVQDLDIPARQGRRLYEAVGKADAKRQADTFQLKATQSRGMVDHFDEIGLEATKRALPALWEMGSGREQDKFHSILVDALKKKASTDKKWATLATEYQLKSQEIGKARAPYILDEFRKVIK